MKTEWKTLGLAALALLALPGAAKAWEPAKPVEVVVPAGAGGGADQMARLIKRAAEKHKLTPKPVQVTNKEGGLGAQAFLYVRNSAGNPHRLLISLSSVFTTPLVTGAPFNIEDLTPVALAALDPFILWVNAQSPYRSAKEYIDAVSAAAPETMKMGGTGYKQEDQLITAMLEKAAGVKFLYLPYNSGGGVVQDLLAGNIDSSVSNPAEAVKQWSLGKLRPLCVFSKARLSIEEKLAGGRSWRDIPTCKEAGMDVTYEMMRALFLPPKATTEEIAYYVDLIRKVKQTKEWRDFVAQAALTDTFIHGAELTEMVKRVNAEHKTLMQSAGFLNGK